MEPGIRAIFVVTACLLGCQTSEREPVKRDAQASASKPSATDKAAPSPAGSGLGDPSNDSFVVERAKDVLSCEWMTRHTFRPVPRCKALEPWYKASKLADRTLLNMLRDKDPKVRFIAAQQLAGMKRPGRRDRAIATRVLDALAVEEFEPVAEWLARAAGFVDAERTGLGQRQQELFTSIPSLAAKKHLLEIMQWQNRDHHYEFTINLARTATDDAIREAAVGAFWLGMPRDKEDEVCKLWLDSFDDPVLTLSARSASWLGQQTGRACSAYTEALLAKIEKVVAAGPIEEPGFAQGLEGIYTSEKSSPSQKRRAKAGLSSILKRDANHWSARLRALTFLVEDAGGGKALARRYRGDKDPLIAERAKELAEKSQKRRKQRGRNR